MVSKTVIYIVIGITGYAFWSSSITSIATINSTGLAVFNGLYNQNTQISATVGSVIGNTDLEFTSLQNKQTC